MFHMFHKPLVYSGQFKTKPKPVSETTVCVSFSIYCGRIKEHIIHNQLTPNDFRAWTVSSNINATWLWSSFLLISGEGLFL